jgi:hypothetical protein
MIRARRAAYWLLPPLVCVALYWYGLKTWFRADDFAWLGLDLDIFRLRDLLAALFAPQAQGTIRPLSERAFFLIFHGLFGLDALPFHLAAFAVQAVNLVLVASVARRLTGSVAAGFWAPLFWAVNSTLALPLGWASVFNQPLCALFLLSAFRFLLRYIETGERRYYRWQWAVFLAGFGALELNLVYPALAAAYTWLCARKFFRSTLPLFAVSAVYVAAHRLAAPIPGQGVYAMHFTGSMARTLCTYWAWSVGPTYLNSPLPVRAWMMKLAIALVSAALLAFAVRRRAGIFCLLWWVITLAPVLPLRDHVTEYYPFIPLVGLTIAGGWAFAEAWRRPLAWKLAATALAALYVTLTAPEARAASVWLYRHTQVMKKVVLGVEAAHQVHFGKTILLEDVDDELFWTCIVDNPFRLLSADAVYLAPGSEARVQPHPGRGQVEDFILPAGVVANALDGDQIVVYSVAGERLRNITSLYARRARSAPAPARLDIASPLISYLLGPEWYPPDGTHRWMPRRATLRLAGPARAGQRLYLAGTCPEDFLRAGPLGVTVTVDGVKLAPAQVRTSAFELAFALPAEAVGKPEMVVAVEASRSVTPPEDGRELALAFGTFEIR